jgi:hypothetical protein
MRDRKLARVRRIREPDEARAEERRRQRERRARAARHAPASGRKRLISREEVRLIVDRVLALSRARLTLDLQGFLEGLARQAGQVGGPVTPEPPLANTGTDS